MRIVKSLHISAVRLGGREERVQTLVQLEDVHCCNL